MDVPRPSRKRQKLVIKGAIVILVVVAISAAIAGLARLEPAAPTVDRATVWTDTVKQGSMVREVRGTGRLVPLRIRWITAPVEGRIEQILLLPGMTVDADTVLLELTNPDLEKEVSDAQWQLKSAEAELECSQVRLQNESLDMDASLARLKAQYDGAKLQAEVDDKLFKDDLLSEREWKLSLAKASQLANLIEIEEKRAAIKRASQPAELAMVKARVEQAKANYERKKSQLASLSVKAGALGVLDQWNDDVEVGRQVNTGMALARVSDTKTLKATIEVPEVQARDVQIGQPARVDIGRTIINGRVLRIDPVANEGTVTVDISLEDPLPKGARPDLTVVGTIEIERLEDVFWIKRPVNGQSDSTANLFKIDTDGNHALRVPVRFGSSSVSTIQVLEGLGIGDEVILSDMSQWDDFDRVNLK